MFSRLLSVLAILFVTVSAVASPADAVSSAWKDLQTVASVDRPFIRYHSLYAVPDKDRETFLKVYAFHVNSLSRRARLRSIKELLVTPELIRIDTRYFRWNHSVYDKLVDIDPYFHVLVSTEETKKVTEDWPGGIWPGDGKEYTKGAFKYQKPVTTISKKSSTATSPWLPTEPMRYLVEETQSKAPILRADWFLVQTATNKDRVAGYYAFLELTNRTDFEKLTGLNVKEAQRLEREIASIVQKSGVSIRNRQIYRFGAIDAGYWQTRDVFKSQTKERNAINSLNGDFKHDAEEHYGYLPNRI